MDDDDVYANVPLTVHQRRPNAIRVAVEDGEGASIWLPRSVIHGGDNRDVDLARLPQAMTLRVRAWKAKQAGLV